MGVIWVPDSKNIPESDVFQLRTSQKQVQGQIRVLIGRQVVVEFAIYCESDEVWES